MSKRIPLLLLTLAALATGRPASAQTHDAPAPGVENVADRAAHAADPAAAHGEAAGHDTHTAIDDRLVPIPPSRETIVSAVWVIVIFVVMLAILYPTAWKNVLAGLKKREERIRRDIADAEASRAKAETTLREYNQQLATAENKIRDMLAKAQADGERIATNLRTQAQTESEEIKNRANREIEAAKNQALAEVYEQTANLATNVAEKILRRNLNADDQRDLVGRSLEQVGTIGKN
jgi:F-type H+-transporting ATPase subunit b